MKSLDTDGEVTIEFEQADSSGKLYREVYDDILSEQFVTIPFSGKIGTEEKSMWMEFRYPPLPPQDGLNIFGQIGYLGLSSAGGVFSIRSQPINIPAPSKLELEGMAGLKVAGGVFTAPIQTKGAEITFEVDAVKKIFLNEDLKNNWGEVHGIGGRLQFVVILCTVAQGAVAIAWIISALGSKPPNSAKRQRKSSPK